jgi:hypothetical protein
MKIINEKVDNFMPKENFVAMQCFEDFVHLVHRKKHKFGDFYSVAVAESKLFFLFSLKLG